MDPSAPPPQQQQQYWCHVCEKAVTTAPQPTGDVVCPDCGSEFVEEYTPPPPAAAPAAAASAETSDDPYVRNILNLFRAVGARQQRRAADPARHMRPQSLIRVDLVANGADLPAAPANPFTALFNLIQRQQQQGQQQGQQQQQQPQPQPRAMTMDELLNHLFVTAPVRGSPPAARAAVEALPRHTVDAAEVQAHADDDFACTVCQDAFAAGDAVVQMPCAHVFHADCLAPWLAMHNSCPTCRCELPTDDPDYEAFKKARRTM